MWKCPACQRELTLVNESSRSVWQCSEGHHYDVAKEGYVNLLLANQKHSKDPGDNKIMINARRQFLEAGYYQPLAVNLAHLMERYMPELVAQHRQVHLFDAGCGEGYYLEQIRQYLQNETGLSVSATGCDIAKNAVQKAAKKYTENHFSVASTYHLPLLSQSQDVVFQIFAPGDAAEIRRVLKQHGIWLWVNAGPRHLQELKALIYQTPELHTLPQQTMLGFEPLYQQTLSFEFTLTTDQARERLLAMTPFYWAASQQLDKVRENLHNVTAEFYIQVMRNSESIDQQCQQQQ